MQEVAGRVVVPAGMVIVVESGHVDFDGVIDRDGHLDAEMVVITPGSVDVPAGTVIVSVDMTQEVGVFDGMEEHDVIPPGIVIVFVVIEQETIGHVEAEEHVVGFTSVGHELTD